MRMAFNITSIKVSSGGVWEGDNPLHFAFPLLIIQTIIVVLISRLLVFLLKPFRQPKVVAEILGGILLGPSALGRNKIFMRWIFPTWSTAILESVASLGLLFFLFLVGLELDLTILRRSGKKAFSIAAVGISVPFLFGVGITFLIKKAVKEMDRVGYAEFFMFIGVSLSITAFPVLARILAELKLLTTEIGQTAMAAAAFNDVAGWILLALAVAVAGGDKNAPLVPVWVLLSGIGFVAFMFIAVRPLMNWVARKSSSGTSNDMVDEACLCLTFAAVMLCGFMTDLIGIHAIFGAFIFGLTIPKEGEFSVMLIKRIEDFVCGLLLPLYFASSGLKTNVAEVQGLGSWGLLLLIICTACAGKVLGTFVVAMFCMIPARDSLALGMLMNTKGLVELIVLNIGKEKKVLDDKLFAILVTMALVTTFMTTPVVSLIYKPMRCIRPVLREKPSSHSSKRSPQELRVIACIRAPRDASSLINLIETARSSTKISAMKLYVTQLFELTNRSSSIVMVQRARKNGFPFIGRSGQGDLTDQVAAAFSSYSQLGQVTVRSTKSISGFSIMHEDICHIAGGKRAQMIILPFHKYWIGCDGDQEVEVNSGNGWRIVNQSVLENSPCSVAVLVDRGFGIVAQRQSLGCCDLNYRKKVCVLFLGGPDCRKALQLGSRMAEHPAVTVSVISFMEYQRQEETLSTQGFAAEIPNPPKTHASEKELDMTILREFRRRWDGTVEIIEKETDGIVEEVLAVGQRGKFDLVIVGKGKFPRVTMAKLENRNATYNELGYVGDLLAASGIGIKCSVLVIEQHGLATQETEKCVQDAEV